ncbi:mechanosensitive ion channel family protein [Victivallis sp. Marseille-Q1083]|uniref:mechanosensitive ion channel family protein n=1 Tax=Victivallis sp. Marseille-Q1083 TaxID=2717288 RepID=UPI001C3757E8|nr:mechanosensitive ion channel family protein [Victivallis sp. Marseille-Q1083]
MQTWLEDLQNVLSPYPWAYSTLAAIFLILVAIAVNWLTKCILLRGLHKLLHSRPSANSEDNAVQLAIVSRLANIVPAVVLAVGVVTIPDIHEVLAAVIRNVCSAFIILTSALAAAKLLDWIDIVYRRRPDASNKPIKGYLQLLKIFIFAVALILVVATLINRNPLILLSGLGAMAAVLMLVFQDTLLSVVASMQIGSNDMVRIGDWIEMPSQDADGYVIEIALHTVKVQNWDKTITTLPIRKLITDAFKNWRGMFESGGRRIKRSLYLDQRSVRFLDDAEIKRLEEFVLLDDYLERKRRELAEWNADLEKQGAKPINERRVTNLGTFRAYVEHYLRSNANINQDMMLLVRQLQPGATGLPLEIYCFTSDVRWVEHEKVQADIFDHLLAILPVFDLRVFQQCSDTSGLVLPSPALLNDTRKTD